MDELHARIAEAAPLWLAWGGFAIGAVFGFVVQATNFCAMGSISDILSFGDYRRFRAWLLAGAVAIVGAQILARIGVVDLGMSMYLGSSINWFGNVLGGVIFGIGMVFAGGCTSRNLVRLGGGDLRSAMVLLVTGLFAYMTVGGILGPLRAWLERQTSITLTDGVSQSMASLAAHASGLSESAAQQGIAGALIVGLLAYCFGERSFRSSPRHIVSGIGIGLCVVAGWALTGLAYDEFADAPQLPLSLSYVRPTGDAMEYLERYTANAVPAFGVATVFGALAGALVATVLTGRFRLAGFADSGDTLRNIAGGALMGIGGVTALGCTIGQGITGLSTLALGSVLAFAAIVVGGIVGMKLMERILLA